MSIEMGKRIKELEGQLAMANQWVLDAQKKADHWFAAATYWSQAGELLVAEVERLRTVETGVRARCAAAEDHELNLAADVLDLYAPPDAAVCVPDVPPLVQK